MSNCVRQVLRVSAARCACWASVRSNRRLLQIRIDAPLKDSLRRDSTVMLRVMFPRTGRTWGHLPAFSGGCDCLTSVGAVRVGSGPLRP